MEERSKPHQNACRERIRKIIEKTLTGKARINEYKDSVGETEEGQERKRARVEQSVEWEQMADRLAVASWRG